MRREKVWSPRGGLREKGKDKIKKGIPSIGDAVGVNVDMNGNELSVIPAAIASSTAY